MVHASKILGATKTNMHLKTLCKGENQVDDDTSNLDIPKFFFQSMKNQSQRLRDLLSNSSFIDLVNGKEKNSL